MDMVIKRLKKDFTILDNKLIAHKGIYGYSNKLKKKIEPNSFYHAKLQSTMEFHLNVI